MLGLFFLVAIFNLMLGFALGRRLPQRLAMRWIVKFVERHQLESTTGQPEIKRGSGATPHTAPRTDLPPKPAPATTSNAPPEQTQTKIESRPSPVEADASPSPTEDWKNLSVSLTNVTDQLSYVRSISDKSLAQQVATKFEQMAESWYNQITEKIEQDEENAEVDDEEMMLLEQFLAQLETTLTNLKLLDWSGEIEDITARLEKEVRTLDESRPQAATAGT